MSGFTRIPIIDFAGFVECDRVSGEMAASAAEETIWTNTAFATAQEIRCACEDVGFLYLRQHGLSAELLKRMFAQSQEFFALPLAEKEKFAWTTAKSNRGYGCTGRERLNPERAGDFKETLNIGREGIADWGNGELKGSELSQTATEFFAACVELANRVLVGMAIALSLPPTFFQVRHNQQPFTLRLLHYPPINTPLAPTQVRAGEHSDYGTITLLFQDRVGGLEVQTTESTGGGWIAAPPIPDTVLINLGDLMQRWTNDVFRSTRHRVMPPVNPEPVSPAMGSLGSGRLPSSGVSRYAIAFFCDANPDVEVACLESCQSPQNPPRYPPILAGEYLLSRLNATYSDF